MEGQIISIMDKFAQMRKAVQTNIEQEPPANNIPETLSYDQLLEKEEEISSTRHSYIDNFFEYMENKFAEMYEYIDIAEMRETLKEIESFINSHKTITSYEEEIIEKLKALRDEINSIHMEKTSQDNINELKLFTYKVKCFTDKIIQQQTNTIPNDNNNNMPISHKKLLFSERRANELQSAVYVDRSKNKDDEVKIIQNDLFLSDEKRFKKTEFKKFLAENFLQIFYVKEKGIFSSSYISNCKVDAFKSYKKYNFYKIKLYVSKNESIDSLKGHLNFMTGLFDKFIIFYFENRNKKFIKLVICGKGKKQNIVKNSLKKYLRNNFEYDTLIKLSMFTNIYSSILPSLRKYEHCNYSTNLSNTLYNKLISMLI
jgi:hypothetical protein